MTYSIKTNGNDLFRIDSVGNLSLATNQSLDYASTNEHQITVDINDGELSDTSIITIDVTNVYPMITNQTFSVDEHSSNGTVIGQIIAMDYGDRTFSYTYSIDNGNSLFAPSTSGELTVNGYLDYESQTSHDIMVSVDDTEEGSGQATITIDLINVTFTLINTTNVRDGGDLELNGDTSVTTAEIGGTTYLFVTSNSDNGMSVFSVTNNGTLNNLHNVDNDSSLELNGDSSVMTAEVGGRTYLFVASNSDNGVSVFRVDD